MALIKNANFLISHIQILMIFNEFAIYRSSETEIQLTVL